MKLLMTKLIVATLFLMVLSLTFHSTKANAAVYKCTSTNGKVEFRDKPCDSGTQENIKVKGVAAAEENAETVDFDANKLVGKWCNWAVSYDRNGEKDRSDPATWEFNKNGTMSYKSKVFRKPLTSNYKVKGEQIQIENKMIGSWGVFEFYGTTMVLSGPYGGYGYYRKGSC